MKFRFARTDPRDHEIAGILRHASPSDSVKSGVRFMPARGVN
jgi:hypothetical protein